MRQCRRERHPDSRLRRRIAAGFDDGAVGAAAHAAGTVAAEPVTWRLSSAATGNGASWAKATASRTVLRTACGRWP